MLALGTVALLLAGKIIATIIAYASGGSGGLFAPTLFMGAMLGGLVGILGQILFGLENEIVGAIALLGMGAMFAAVIRCPMTSIVIIWEMTGQYALILPLMAGNMLAWLVSSRLMQVPLYDALLLQDKISLKRMPHYKGDQDWQNLPISSIMSFDVVTVGAEETIKGAVERLLKEDHKHHGYPVIDGDKRLVGVVTHHEMVEKARETPDLRVADLPTRHKGLVTVRPETSIRDVAPHAGARGRPAGTRGQREGTGPYRGLVTLHDIARQQNAIDDSMGR